MGGLTVIHRLHFGHVPCPDGAVELILQIETLRMERGEVRGDRMRETEGHGGHTHTHSRNREREGGRGEMGGGLTAIHRLHFGHVPCPDGAVLARALPVRDILTSVHAGAVARLPGAIGLRTAVRGRCPRFLKDLPALPDAPEHAQLRAAVALQLRPVPRCKHGLHP